jgi:hypothetical protein
MITVFLIGIFTALAAKHAYAHFKPQPLPEISESHTPIHHRSQEIHLSPAVKERLLKASQVHFQSVLNRSATDLQHDLKTTSLHLNQQLKKLGTEIVSEEMRRYHAGIDHLRKQAETNLINAQSEIATHQADLLAKLDANRAALEVKLNDEITAEKQLIIKQLDTKIADILASFLTETLQHDIDLGSQNDYLIKMLEKNKADLIKEITSEA